MRSAFVNAIAKHTGLFLLVVILINLLVIKIPFDLLFKGIFDPDTSGNINRAIHGIILVIFSIVLIRRFSLEKLAGIKLFFVRTPVLLIIPFVFPMPLAIPGFSKFGFSGVSSLALVIFLLAVLAKAAAEEYGFRGLVQAYLIKKYNDKVSIYTLVHISAVIFALMHTINLVRLSYIDVISQVIYAFYFGVFFGALLLHIRNVFLLAFIHGLINFAFNPGLIRGLAGDETVLVSNAEALRSVLTFAIVLFPLWIIGMLLLKTLNKKRLATLMK